jgi:MobA-like NTP transferase domain
MADGQVLVVLAAGRARRYGGVKPLAPVGPGGEAVLDLLAGDALAAGFSTLVLVLGPATGPAIRYHVERTWPSFVDVRFARQEVPLGTVHAVLAAADHLGDGRPFGIANADDLYGLEPLAQLAGHLGDPAADTNALVGFRLRNAVVGPEPVTRGICQVGPDAMLRAVVERRQVRQSSDGRFVAGDGLDPAELDGDALVSMNLWGFGPEMLDELAAAMDDRADASEEAEVLLPEVVGAALNGGRARGARAPQHFRVLPTDARCVGVTHPDDLALVQAQLAAQVGRGERAADPWAASR